MYMYMSDTLIVSKVDCNDDEFFWINAYWLCVGQQNLSQPLIFLEMPLWIHTVDQ